MPIQRKNWLLSRRHALRGLGVSLALPLLDVMRPLSAAASAAKQVGGAKRSVFIYLPNGVNTYDWQMAESGAGYTLSKPLASLEKHRENITPFSGLYHPNGMGHHHNCQTIWLTSGEIGEAKRNSISVDQRMAQVTGPKTRYSSVELSNEGGSLAWNADGIQLPSLNSPAAMFRQLFEEPKGGIAHQRRGLHRRGSILDAVLDEARALAGDLPREDRGRLDQYLTSVREVEVRTERADSWLDMPRPMIDPADRSKLNRGVSLQMLGEYLRTMYDLIVLAFQTDVTRVVTFNTGAEGKGLPIPEIGVQQTRHALSHHNGNAQLLGELTDSDTFNIEQFSYFLDRLATTEDADGPLLDTTMALYGSGMAFGHSHGNASLPIILAGGKALGLRHGTHIDFNKTPDFKGYKGTGVYHRPVNDNAHLSNLLLTMAQKMDVETETFGDSLTTVSEVLS